MTTQTKAIFDNVTPSDLGMALHTALRKGCDSKPTSAVWNMANVLNEPWIIYLELLLERLKALEQPALTDLREQTLDLWHPFGDIDKLLREDGSARSRRDRNLCTAMSCMFELFDDNDWYGYGCYLDNYGVRLEDVKQPKLEDAAHRLNETLREMKQVDQLVSVGVGEVKRVDGIYVYVTDKKWRYVDILEEHGFMGYPVKVERTSKIRPC